jgi:hypothetical protein
MENRTQNVAKDNLFFPLAVSITGALFSYSHLAQVDIEKNKPIPSLSDSTFDLSKKDWEARLNGLGNTGKNIICVNPDIALISQAHGFAKKYIQDITPFPPQLEKIFNKRFRDILA